MECTCEHENGRFWKLKLVDEQILHALGVVDAALELVSGVLVGYPADDGLLPAVGRMRRSEVVVRRRGQRRRRRRRLGVRRRRRRGGAWIGDVSDGLA